MKKKLLTGGTLITLGLFLFSGCSTGDAVPQYMDRPSADGKYHYSNEKYGFSVVLPAEFEYYQTQSREYPDFSDIEFYVPTSDMDYYQEVPGYGKIMTARMYDKDFWNGVKNDADFSMYTELGEKDDLIYTISFWINEPKDWEDKFTNELIEEVLESFSLN